MNFSSEYITQIWYMLKVKHYYVNILDAPELFPFTIRLEKDLSVSLKKQDRARQELDKFINKLSKDFKEPIWSSGCYW